MAEFDVVSTKRASVIAHMKRRFMLPDADCIGIKGTKV
jgi:hypothetical protein